MYNEKIIEHLASMCHEPADIEVVGTEQIGDDALFVTFTADGWEQKAVYYPSDDILFTPIDWQARMPRTPGEIEEYIWQTSAFDDAVVIDGLPRVFAPFRDQARKDFGRKVRAAREDRGLSQEDVARMSGIKQTNISRIESGRYSVTLDTITRLSLVLGEL